MSRFLTTALAALCLQLAPLEAEPTPRPVRDSVARLVDRLARAGGNFPSAWAAGEYNGDKAPLSAVLALFETSPDSVLLALVDCFTDTAATRLRFKDTPISRGAVCYIILQNLVYRETEGEEWPGNFYRQPTPERLRAAQQAWRQAVRHHWYSPA